LHSAEKPEIQADRISGFLFFGFKFFQPAVSICKKF